jgi:CDP-diglyceride synthetase
MIFLPMNLEGEYAVDKNQRAHRIASCIVYAVWIGLSFHTNGIGQAFKTAAYYILPMACIWFPDAMASYTGIMWGRGRFIEERSHPVFLRWGGWFLLLIAPLFLIVMLALSR